MDSNRTLIFFIFGICMLPKIYSDGFPSLFLSINEQGYYIAADKFEYVEGQNNAIRFSALPEDRLYYACPEEGAPHFQKYALKVGEYVTDFEARSLQLFVKGDFDKYNCRNEIKPIALKVIDNIVTDLDIGFLIHAENTYSKLWKRYENLPTVPEYEFTYFLTITMDQSKGTIVLVKHQIISREILEPDSPWDALPPNEKNEDIYGFDIDSLYAHEYQKAVFSSIFNEFHTNYYNQLDRFLFKVQLAPYEDFLLDIWKLPSFADLNTTAMWTQLNSQWRKIEVFVRKVARELDGLDIETGTAQILKLTDSTGQKKPVYLREGQRSPVNNYIWKIVKFDQLNDPWYTQAILIVMHNDPYTSDQIPICQDVSENLGWIVSNNDFKTGLTYVCEAVHNTMRQLYDMVGVNYSKLDLRNVQKFERDNDGNYVLESVDIYSKIMSRS